MMVMTSAVTALLRFQPQLRRLKRWIKPYDDNPANSLYALERGLEQIHMLRSAGGDLSTDILELGTGWLPIVPMLFHLAGARRLFLTDVDQLMDASTVAKAKRIITEHLSYVLPALGHSDTDCALKRLHEFAPEYVAPWDVRTHPRTQLTSSFRARSWSISPHISLTPSCPSLVAFYEVVEQCATS